MDNLVSVIIPTYNRAHCIRETVQSVLDQTYQHFELIVVDDGSNDNTLEVLRVFGDRVRVISQTNSGVSAARNLGTRIAVGKYLAFLDSDDTWLPEKLEHQLKLMGDEGIILSVTNWRSKTENEPANAFAFLTFEDSWICERPTEFVSRIGGHNIMLSSWVVRRDKLLELGGFDAAVDLAEDNHLLFRLAFRGRFAFTKKVLLLRDTDFDEVKLTRPGNNLKYQRKATRAMCIAASNARVLAFGESKLVQRQFQRLYSYYLRREMELAAMDGHFWIARRRAFEVLLNKPCAVDALMAAVGIVAPFLIRIRERKKYLR